MATRKKGGGRRKIKRFAPEDGDKKRPQKPKATKPAPEKTPMQKRIKENNAGFGILKGVGVVIFLLIVGSAVLFNRAGGREAMRGDKAQGELCEKTVECAKGSICYAFQDDRSRCRATCSKSRPCDPDFTCVTAAAQKRKRGIRLADICVENDQI